MLATDIEGPANPLLKKLLSGTAITASERGTLAIYVATMLTRVPKNRERAWAHVPSVLDSTVSRIKGEVAQLGDQGRLSPERVAALLRQLGDLHNAYQAELPVSLREELIEDPFPSPVMVKAVHALQWRILVTAEPEFFITTDNPAFFHGAYGLGTEKSELRFPLSPTHALHGTWVVDAPVQVTYHDAPKTFVREFNRSLASDATRLVFCHRRVPWLTKILHRRNPYLSRLVWT